MSTALKGKTAVKARYEIDYYPGVTAEVFAVVDGQRQAVDSFSELRMAIEYCREGFTSSGEKVQWEVSRDQGATLFRSQEIPIPDQAQSARPRDSIQPTEITAADREADTLAQQASTASGCVASEPSLEDGPRR